MKWLKHCSNSRFDPKIRKLIRKYSAKGFGIYWALNESLAENIETNQGQLEHTTEDLGETLNESPLDVKEVLDYCIECGLISSNGKKYSNIKVFKYADEYTQRRKTKYPDSVPTLSRHSPDSVGVEEKEEKRKKEVVDLKIQTATDFFKEKEKTRIASVKAQQDKALKDFLEGE